jgi:hypothetical protein
MKRIVAFTTLIIFTSCGPQRQIAGNYAHKCECISVEGDGSFTILAWGEGRNRFDALEQAKKNAVREVLFKGIIDGKGDCDKRPLITEVNAEEKYEDYFVKFFADKGPYTKYVVMKDERIEDKILRDRQASSKDITNSAVVRVLRFDLKQKLIEDNIITKN